MLCDSLANASVSTDSTGRAAVNLPLPVSSAIVGTRLHGQYLVVDPPMNQLGLVTTNAATLTIGGYR